MVSILRNTKLFGNTVDGNDMKAWKYYLENSKYRDNTKINMHRHYCKVINGAYKKIARGCIEYEGGFLDPKFFALLPTRSVAKRGKKEFDNDDKKVRHTFMTHTKGYIYKMTFINLLRLEHRRAYDMTKTINRNIITAFRNFLENEAFKYKFPIWDMIRNPSKSK